ncbi:BrnA antitoxin family protein [Methylobacterium sp. JK268]
MSTDRDHAPGYVPNPNYTQEDWDEVSDSPEITEEQMRAARPLREARPGLYAALKAHQSRTATPPKVMISLRVDPDVLEKWRAKGPGWQTQLHDLMRKHA